VLGTVLGACAGLAIVSIPHIFSLPDVMLACVAAGSVMLGMAARAQARTGIVLALLTLCAVVLCTFQTATMQAGCCSARLGPVDVFLARLTSVVGGCLLVMAFNRLVLPMYTSDYALEQLADALQASAALYERVYRSQFERMRLSELVAGALQQQAGDEPPADAAEAAAAALAAAEVAEAQLHVQLRQDVLGRLVDVQLLLAREAVSFTCVMGWLSTPALVLNVLGAMNAVKEALASQRLALAPFTKPGADSMAGGTAAAGAGARKGGGGGGGGGMLHSMRHCYSMWAKPLHPVWLEVSRAACCMLGLVVGDLRLAPARTTVVCVCVCLCVCVCVFVCVCVCVCMFTNL
jgi:hypothetical protein